SATAIAWAAVLSKTIGVLKLGINEPGAVWFINTLVPLPVPTITSGFPSPFRSATAIDVGVEVPAAKGIGDENVSWGPVGLVPWPVSPGMASSSEASSAVARARILVETRKDGMGFPPG